jgi:ABC-type multidrug transport system ATPase subunit
LVLLVENLGKKYGKEWIFRKFAHQFEPNTIYAITGANGSGKSTLLKTLSAALPPSEGTLILKNLSTSVSPDNLYKHVSWAAPYLDLVEDFTLAEMLNFHFKFKQPIAGIEVGQVASVLELGTHLNKPIRNFSSGMKQRLKAGLAILSKSDILILDEPGSNLDALAKDWLSNLISEFVKNRIVIIASNEENEINMTNYKISLLDYKYL